VDSLTTHQTYDQSMRNSFPKLIACLVITALATACGGGGGGSSTSSAPAPTPMPAPEPVPNPNPAPPELFRISGTITASGSQAVDSDTNDPASQAISNDTFASAQPIPNPITLGGYINQPGTGAEGRSRIDGDINDFFRLDLLAGQRVTMLVADFEQADADLYLYDLQEKDVAHSIETGEIETVVVPADGTYLVNAFALDGATNYILAIGTSNTLPSQQQNHYNIVPWQTVVKYKDNDAPADSSNAGKDIARRLGMEQRAGGRGRGRLMALRRSSLTAAQQGKRLGAAASKLGNIADPDLRARWETLMAIKSLRRDPQVEYAEPNYEIRALATPDDEAYPFQWHYPLIALPEAWDTSTGNPEVVIAVVDTGVLSNHPDLAGQLVEGYDFVRDPVSARDGDGIDPDPQDPGNNLGAGSSSFHGTHVSGTVAARGNNSRGVAGAAYTSRVMPVRALGVGGAGTSYDVDQAVRFAAGLPNDSGTLPLQAADIINLSLGGGPFSRASQALYDEVRAAGVLVVAAAGNEASSLPGYPASYEGVISVSAVNAQRQLTPYSNFGSKIDIAAPGGDSSEDLNGDGYPDGVLSTGGSSTASGLEYAYTFLSGTSMASPHVAAVLALMKSVNPQLTPADIDALLVRGDLSDDLGASGRDDLYGHGIINAQRAVLAALEASGSSPADSPRLTASASTLNFGGTVDTLQLVLRNGGKGELELEGIEVSRSWLRVAAQTVDASGLGTYRVTVDRSDLPPGNYAATITAQSSINSLSVRALIAVGGAGTSADVGVIYILLYDSATDEVVAQFVSTANEGEYPFEFDGIAAGEYGIIAGSDADNDLFICDSGEACGAWLTIDQPIRIQLQGDIDNVDFPIEYIVSLPSIGDQAQSVTNTRAQQDLPGAGKGIAKTPLYTDD
jgi:serine protease